jgi:energy-coupling factor transporter ATP-binding protein EcfA2
MKTKLYDIRDKEEYRAATPFDMIKLIPASGNHSHYKYKYALDIISFGICNQKSIHLSGPTGAGKSSLIEAITEEPENFKLLCEYSGYEYKPPHLYEIEMVKFDTPGECHERTVIKNRDTVVVPSEIIEALLDSQEKKKDHYPIVYFMEMGRVHTASIQGGLLNIVGKPHVKALDNQKIPTGNVCFIADSNYQAADDATYTLVTFDEALKRRFDINLSIPHFPEENQVHIMHDLVHDTLDKKPDVELIKNIIKLGQMISQYKAEGNLVSVTEPNPKGYLTCYEMIKTLPGIGINLAITNSMLGNAATDDLKLVDTSIQTVFYSHQITADRFSTIDDVF